MLDCYRQPLFLGLWVGAWLVFVYFNTRKAIRIGNRTALLQQQLQSGAIDGKLFRELYAQEINKSWIVKGMEMLAAKLGYVKSLEEMGGEKESLGEKIDGEKDGLGSEESLV